MFIGVIILILFPLFFFFITLDRFTNPSGSVSYQDTVSKDSVAQVLFYKHEFLYFRWKYGFLLLPALDVSIK